VADGNVEPREVDRRRHGSGFAAGVSAGATPGAVAPASRFAWHDRHRVIPRMSQITQMNVPQSTQGYPSDARSSFPQERQTIASCS
jgi:hypothetical protein